MIHRIAALAIGLLLAPFPTPAQDGPPSYLLITNVNLWDGSSDVLAPDMNVLVENNLIKQVSAEPIPFNPSANAGRWLAKSGPKNPYKEGALGVIEVGAYADMILVEGNPLEDVSVVADYKNNVKVVIKDGEIFKNALQ